MICQICGKICWNGIPSGKGPRLLQVGSGYGALTGVYSEKAAQVDVLDPDAGDLEVNELRQKQYEGRENIRYIQDELCHYVESGAYMQDQMADGAETEAVPDGINTDSAGYDYVVFVGSLEPSKAAEQIRAAKRCLVSGGELIIAACNPFGLKYWLAPGQMIMDFLRKRWKHFWERMAKLPGIIRCRTSKFRLPFFRMNIFREKVI